MKTLFAFLILAASAIGQTKLAGPYTATGPLSTMTGLVSGLPATCVVGQEYFATDATAGSNKYLCTATNTWTQQTGGGTPGGSNGQVQYNNSSAFGGVTVGGLPTNAITVSGNATLASVVSSCIDKTVVYSTDLTTASGTVSVTLGTGPVHWIWTDVWARETVTFAGTSMTTATVSVGPAGSETNILPTVSLKQSTNTVTSNAVGYAPSDSATAIVAQFVITAGGGTWSQATAGTYDLRVCGHAGR